MLDVGSSYHSRHVKKYNYLNIMKIKQNPVRDYLSVENGNTTIPCMPSGMQSVSYDMVAFLWNAGVTCDAIFYREIFPIGMVKHDIILK